MLLDMLRELDKANTILFTVRPGGPGALMSGLGFVTQKIPPKWIQRLVRKALIAPLGAGSSSKVACMGWIQYVITHDGQMLLRGRGG
jgi:hypothetical protein